MNSNVLKEKVSIIGMGCTRFGEHFDKSSGDLMIEASQEAFQDAGIGPDGIQAAWVGTAQSGTSGEFLANPLKLDKIPISRVENACASGIDALRNAVYAVALGVYDVALVMGVEKLKDTGLSGLPDSFSHPVYGQGATAPGRWALAATRFFADHKLAPEQGRSLLAKIAMKNHHNGSMHPKAHFRREITMEMALNAPVISWPLGLFDCCPTTDGAACAIICSTGIAKKFRDDYINVRSFGLAIGPGWGKEDIGYRYDILPETMAAGKQAYDQAGVRNPREELSLAELHDCFSIAELLEYEPLGLSNNAVDDVENAYFALDGGLPVNSDGGLKAFGHPIGATGLRMCYEVYKQIQGKAQSPQRQLKNATMGLCMAQGGHPGWLMPAVTILKARDD